MSRERPLYDESLASRWMHAEALEHDDSILRGLEQSIRPAGDWLYPLHSGMNSADWLTLSRPQRGTESRSLNTACQWGNEMSRKGVTIIDEALYWSMP